MVHAPHGRYINAGNLSPITRSQQAASRDLGRISLLIAFSRRSDNGVRREGREREKNKEEKRERGGTLTPTPPPRFCCFFFFSSHISLWCPHDLNAWNKLLCWSQKDCSLKCGQLYRSIYVSKILLYSIIRAPSALIIFGTTFTLFIFHNSHSRSKNINSVFLCGFSFTVISSECDSRITLTAQAKGMGALGTRTTIFFCFYYY